MRMRGANSTDIAILVVAADDGVMPQTIEAINHAKAAGIEIIVAINKIDKPSANIERVKQELVEYELIPEDWGGSTIFVPVSAHTHEGIDQLLEMILLTAEVLELKANPNRRARGLVIEAELDKGKGPVATVLVQKGTLHVGDPIAVGACHGKVRAMMDDNGRRVKEAGPSKPVEILGLNDVPNAGEIFVSPETDKEARTFAETYVKESREKLIEDTKMKMSLDDLYSQIQSGNLKELNIIVKADVQGSVEAVKQSLLKLSNEEVVVKIIHGGVGAINESDVSLAAASNAIIIGFNVRPDATAKETAERGKGRPASVPRHLRCDQRCGICHEGYAGPGIRGEGPWPCGDPPDLQGLRRGQYRRLLCTGRCVPERLQVPYHERRRPDLRWKSGIPEAFQGRCERSKGRLRMRPCVREVQRHSGAGYRRGLYHGGGAQIEHEKKQH